MKNSVRHIGSAVLGVVLGYVGWFVWTEYGSTLAESLFKTESVPKDSLYIRSREYKNGSSQIESEAPPLRYSENGAKYDEGVACIRRGRFPEAEQIFREILARTPKEAAAGQGLGSALFLQGRYAESAEAFHSVLDEEPRFFNARVGLGAVARVEGRYADAVVEYTLAIRDNEHFALSYHGRGVSYFHIGKLDEAEADLAKAIELLPKSADLAIEARDFLARVRAKREHLD